MNIDHELIFKQSMGHENKITITFVEKAMMDIYLISIKSVLCILTLSGKSCNPSYIKRK